MKKSIMILGGALFMYIGLSNPAIARNYENQATDLKYNQWLWHPAQELIQSWGQPHASKKLANGNKLIIYHQVDYTHRLNYLVNLPSAAANVMRVECLSWFEVDPHNIIVKVNISRNHCPETVEFKFGP